MKREKNSISLFKSLFETKKEEFRTSGGDDARGADEDGKKTFSIAIVEPLFALDSKQRNPSITGKGIKNSLQHFPVHCTLHRQIVRAYIQHLSVNLLNMNGTVGCEE
jgi:hypothetical protein